MDFEKLTFGQLNGNPWWRGVRVLVFAAISAGLTALITTVPDIDWPGAYDVMITGALTSAFTALDKAIRGADTEE